MNKKPSSFLISDIAQEDAVHFTIVWTDQKVQSFRLSTIQAACPCAKCSQETNGSYFVKVDPQVSAHTISSVGRYALKISFTSGCSYGIYPFSLLRTLGKEKE